MAVGAFDGRSRASCKTRPRASREGGRAIPDVRSGTLSQHHDQVDIVPGGASISILSGKGRLDVYQRLCVGLSARRVVAHVSTNLPNTCSLAIRSKGESSISGEAVMVDRAQVHWHRRSGAVRRTELRCTVADLITSRFRVRCCASPRNDRALTRNARDKPGHDDRM